MSRSPIRSGSETAPLVVVLSLTFLISSLVFTGCMLAPVGADRSSPAMVYRQTHQNAVSHSQPSRETQVVLHRFDQVEAFDKTPEATLQIIHQKAVESRERSLLFALSELNYLTGERIRRSVKPWEPRDARDYYLASAVYAWLFLFGKADQPPPGAFDQRFRTACDFYNYSLGWALTQRRSTNALVALAGGPRRLPTGGLSIQFTNENFPDSLADVKAFVVADQFVVRGLSVRNRQPGLGAPLIAVSQADPRNRLNRCSPATVFLRVKGQLPDLAKGDCPCSLELYSGFQTTPVQVGDRSVPLETDTTVPIAYALNQPMLWRLGIMQFLSFEEHVATGVYLTQPYQPGKVPVVFVHGTFSSPIYWSEMVNTLYADPVLRDRCQFWYFTYNSGNPTAFSAIKLRQALEAKIKALDPEGKDPALKHMVVIGHSQGGLLTKLTATDTGDKLLEAVLKTNRLQDLNLTTNQLAAMREFACFKPLPFVTRVVFISTPHRGSYLASSFSRRLARKFVALPSKVVTASKELTGLQEKEKVDIPEEARGAPTSLDSMSPKNPALLALAEIPLAPGVKGNSIIACLGDGDFHRGKDGLVEYGSAHIDYAESELVVRGPHSCQDLPATIEEVRRILREHVASSPAPQGTGAAAK